MNTIYHDELVVFGFIRRIQDINEIIPNGVKKICYQHYHILFQELDPVPGNKYDCDHLSKLNEYEFVTVNEHSPPSYSSQGMLKYNIINNKWTFFFKHQQNAPYTITKSGGHTVNCDDKNKLIYICSDDHLMIVNAETNGYEYYYKLQDDVGCSPAAVIVDGVFHLIGGAESCWHKVWDPINKQFNKIYEFVYWRSNFGIHDHGLVYIKGNSKIKKTMILFGGYYPDSTRDLTELYNKIWYYSFNDNNWKMVKDFKYYMYGEAYILTNNQRYIIIFWSNRIDILDLINLPIISHKKIDMEIISGSKAVIMPNDDIHIADNEHHHKVNVKDIIPSYQNYD